MLVKAHKYSPTIIKCDYSIGDPGAKIPTVHYRCSNKFISYSDPGVVWAQAKLAGWMDGIRMKGTKAQFCPRCFEKISKAGVR